jgi:hypothetical protein
VENKRLFSFPDVLLNKKRRLFPLLERKDCTQRHFLRRPVISWFIYLGGEIISHYDGKMSVLSEAGFRSAAGEVDRAALDATASWPPAKTMQFKHILASK